MTATYLPVSKNMEVYRKEDYRQHGTVVSIFHFAKPNQVRVFWNNGRYSWLTVERLRCAKTASLLKIPSNPNNG